MFFHYPDTFQHHAPNATGRHLAISYWLRVVDKCAVFRIREDHRPILSNLFCPSRCDIDIQPMPSALNSRGDTELSLPSEIVMPPLIIIEGVI